MTLVAHRADRTPRRAVADVARRFGERLSLEIRYRLCTLLISPASQASRLANTPLSLRRIDLRL